MDLEPSEWLRILCGGVLATYLALSGYRKGSLNKTGASAAFIVGFFCLSSSLRFGITLLVFYYSSSKLTRFRSSLKKKIEDGHSNGGNRNATQVFASSLPATILAVWSAVLYRVDKPISSTASYHQSLLNLAYLLFLSACTGDTWSSEVGLVLPGQGSEPVLITNWNRKVPRGTNGGISTEGSIASAVGGAFIGFIYFITSPSWTLDQLSLVFVGLLGGLIGSAIDSVLGSLFQASWFDPVRNKILKHTPKEGSEVYRRSELICGYDIVNGEVINLVSAMLTMCLAFPCVHIF